MKKILLVFSILLSLNIHLRAQSYWIQKAGGAATDEALDISSDAQGNTYSTGYFSTNATFGTTTLISAGVTDVFLTKTNSTGQFQWAIKGGGVGSDRGLSVKTDALGNSVVTGYYYNTATFGTQTISSSGLQDIFIAKYDNTGSLLWVKSAGGTAGDIGNAVNLDNNGNVIVTGEFSGSAQFGTTTLTSMNGTVDVFTTKLDANGNFLWAKKGSASQIDRGLDVACDASGNVYVTGQFTDTITFDVTHITNMYNAVFLIKYNSSGTEQWFRMIGGGSLNIANAIGIDGNNNIILAGDFLGTITFFNCPGNVTLSNNYPRRIFAASYNPAGDLNWKEADGSDADVDARNLSIDASNNVFVTGNFKCKFSEYADQYGQGIFNTVGFSDVFVTKYNSSGSWQWSRQIGGKLDDSGNGITMFPSGKPAICGSFNGNLNFPTSPSFIGYNYTTANNMAHNSYCSDPNYGSYGCYFSNGGYDAFLGMAIDPLRAPYDYYTRFGTGCVLDFVGVCINNNNNADNMCAKDSIDACGIALLYANSNTSAIGPSSYGSIGPDFTYQWSTGATTRIIFVVTSGYYSVTLTSADGCFSSQDDIYVTIHPNPPPPLISDDVIVNTNNPAPDSILLCAPDSAWLWGSGFAPGDSVWWTDPNTGQNIYDDSLQVFQTGYYCFHVQTSYFCPSVTCVFVEIDSLLPPIVPNMHCLQDMDYNDSIGVCQGSSFTMLVFDTISNPLGLNTCLPPNATIIWSVTPSTISYITTTSCQPTSTNTFVPQATGWYAITALVIRKTGCDTDTVSITKNIYIELYPVPVLLISGNALICPGDSTLLIASGSTSYSWTLNNVLISNNDSLWASQTGSYYCYATNNYGCTAGAWTTVSNKPPPTVTMNPASGLLCPNDSVALTCTGPGTFQWYGPNGPFGGNNQTVYVNTPGNYYCVLVDTTGCTLVSNTVTIIQYATPYIQALPDTIICPDDTVIVNVITNVGSTIQWLPPLSGNSSIQIITAPGTYVCSIVSCGIVTLDTITISLSTPFAQITALDSLVFCMGDSALLTANSGNYTYNWSPYNLNSQTIYAYDSGMYVLTVTDVYGCSAHDTLMVNAYPNPLTTPLVMDTFICEGKNAVLNVQGMPVVEWFTVPNGTPFYYGNTYSTPPLYNSLTYYVQSHAGGCRSTITQINITVDDCPLTIPNVFTPNGDGINDIFTFHSEGMQSIECKIFNRWGNLIYEWNDILGGWDGTNMHNGKLVSDGVYYYIADIVELNGTIHREHGFIQVLQN